MILLLPRSKRVVKRAPFLLLVIVLINTAAIAGKEEGPMAPPVKFVPEWLKQPSAPGGWKKVDDKSAYISNDKYKDVFMLVTDSTNDMLLWFRKIKGRWEMNILMTVPTKDHAAFGVKTEDLRIFISKQSVVYGVDGSEAVFIFRWIPEESHFSIYAPQN